MGKWLIFSAWPYINSEPHLGTLMHLITADYYTRFLKAIGEEAYSVSGSDEHGTPIEVEAIKRGINPREFTDSMHALFLDILKGFSVELDNYTRTESEVHKAFVQEFYSKLEEKGYIFKSSTKQLYCERDRMFLPDRFVIGTCPYCGYDKARGDQCERCGRLLEPTALINPRCAICGGTPVVKETMHWYFDLPKLSDKINEYVSGLDEGVRGYLAGMLKEGLKPRAVTRDNRWGIPAPFNGAKGKTIYVWMEAVLGYLSGFLELSERLGDREMFERFWKSAGTHTVYFMGKDNIPFHAVILPALLMASGEGYVLPERISYTEFLLFEGSKFSKSQGKGVWAKEALSIADGEYWRYVILSLRPERGDSNFSWKEFIKLVNGDLNDTVGNFLLRATSFAYTRFNGEVPRPAEQTNDDELFTSEIAKIEKEFIELNMSLRIKDAVRKFVETADAGNKYMSRREPWKLYKLEKGQAATVIYNAIQAVARIAFMMYPVMPNKAKSLASQLNMEELTLSERWEILSPGHKINEPHALFSKVNFKRGSEEN